VTHVPLDRLLAEADAVVVACALTSETRGLLDERRLRTMKPGALLVNVARGGIVVQSAVVDALRDGHLAGAGLDVVDPEPLPADDPLLAAPSFVGAPHSLGYTEDLVGACVEEACAALLAVAAGREPPNLVNSDVLDNPSFVDKLERLGGRGHGCDSTTAADEPAPA
jgi:phosphoglycerate dehydrogenase-like enzyme